MSKDLHQSGHRERDYNRPNAKWLCGYSSEGRECPLGPCSKGGCRGTGECLPIKKGERWYCSRPESLGGECRGGPDSNGQCSCKLSPCHPRRSLREVRKRVSIGVVFLTLGFLIAVLSSKPKEAAINAGPLTSAHAGANLDCQSCHVEPSLADLGSISISSSTNHLAIASSQLCLECHGGEIGEWESSARFAHGWTAEHAETKAGIADEEVSESESNFNQVGFELWMASKNPAIERRLNEDLACSTCHQEHHGSEFSLTLLADQQCQICHQKQFHSFDDGHPTFASTDYPYSRRTRIYFDHASHFGKHFSEKGKASIAGFDPDNPYAQSVTCMECHEADAGGEFMKVKSYEASCAKCHEESVTGGDALTLLAIPEVSDSSAAGEWPKSSYGLIPSMRLFLSKELNRRVSESGSEDELGSIWIGDESNAELASAVGEQLQDLFFSAWEDGGLTLASKVAENGYRFDHEGVDLFSGLSIDTVRRLLFPGTGSDLSEIIFPAIDQKTLNLHLSETGQRSIGLWPAKSAAPLTSVMHHFLSHREGMQSDLELLARFAGEDGNLRLDDLSEASEPELLAVERIVWEIKQLYLELNENGAPYLEELELLHGGILDHEPTTSVLKKVFFAANSDLVFAEGVVGEVKAFRNGDFPSAVAVKSQAADTKSTSGGDDDFGADDDFGDDAAKTPDAGGDDDFGADDDFGGDAAKAPDAGGDDDFGADDNFGDDVAKTPDAGGDDDFGADDNFGGGEKRDETDKSESVPNKFKVFEPYTADWHSGGGWFYESHAVQYRSRGHSDPVIKAWIDAVVLSANSDDDQIKANALRVLAQTFQGKEGTLSNASGQCFKCHTIDRDLSDQKLVINWLAGYSSTESRNASSDLTRFSHAKHYIGMDCISCHAPSDTNSYSEAFPHKGEGFEKLRPDQFSSNFLPLNERESCANCHQKSKAGNSCIQCHDYHSSVGIGHNKDNGK